MKLLFLTFFIFYFSSGHTKAPLCQDLFVTINVPQTQALLDQEFASLFHSKRIYRCLECHINTKRFLQALKTKHPNYPLDELRILYITHKNLPADVDPDIGFHVKSSRGSTLTPEHIEYAFWNFHVVIEFRGKIYDLDFTESPTPISLRDYVQKIFLTKDEIEKAMEMYDVELEGPSNDLIMYSIPASQYLSYSHRELNSWGFHLELYRTQTPTPLLDFVNMN